MSRKVELALLVSAALAALAFQLTLPSRLPSTEDDAAAAAALRDSAQPGDAVVLQPWWTERARTFLPDGVPAHGYLGVERNDFRAHPRLWVLAQDALPRGDQRAFERGFLPGRTQLGAPRRLGHYTLTAYANDRFRERRFSAAEALGSARMEIAEQGRAPAPCVREGDGFQCPGGLRVRREWHEVRFEPRRCLFLKPPGGAARLVGEWAGVPGDTVLRLEAGIIFEYAFARGPELRTVQLAVDDAATGARLLTLSLPPGREGIQQVEQALPPGPQRTVRLSVQADSAESRELCVDLFAEARR